jgi:hypothetical protein
MVMDLVEAEALQLAMRKAIPGTMSRFRITELSGVTKPAQEGARAVFMKRAADPPARDPEPSEPSTPEGWAARRTAVEKACEAIAAEMVTASDGKLTFEKAFDQLLREHPTLAQAVI